MPRLKTLLCVFTLLLYGGLFMDAEATQSNVQSLPMISDLPNPLKQKSGKLLSSKSGWERQRQYLLDMVLRYQYGELPPMPPLTKAAEISERPIPSLQAVEKQVLLTFGENSEVQVTAFVTIPEAKGKLPVVIKGDMGWGRLPPQIVEEVVGRKYVLVEFDRTQFAPDSAERKGIYTIFPDYQGGRLTAWAWGYHRVIDWLCLQSFTDKKRIAITGHSRGGKAVMVAGATDKRIALTAPNNSGCGGAGSYRIQGEKSEDIKAITDRFPFWFHPKFPQFIGNIDRLPFDQHTVKALVAPRAFFSTEALDDQWANPSGSQQSHLAAKEVYDFLGVSNKIGIVFRPGKHEQNLSDWQALLDFADLQFFGKASTRRFDALAFPELPKPKIAP